MTDRFYDPDSTLTLEQHQALNLQRPLTDPPLGADATRRINGASASAVYTTPDTFDIANRTNPRIGADRVIDKAGPQRKRPALAPDSPVRKRKGLASTSTAPETENAT